MSKRTFTMVSLFFLNTIFFSAVQAENLTEQEKAGLLLMREEEKVAYDVYSFLYEKWNLRTFQNIIKSELQHTNSVKALLNTYKIEDPVTTTTRGVYKNQELTKLYNELTALGGKSIKDAITVGLTVEDLDINDLKKLIAETRNADLIQVYTNLLEGSYNHLKAFSSQAKKYSISYTPQYISPDEYNSIISKPDKGGRH